MTEKHTGLANIGIAAPCQSSWDKMSGDATVRFCQECKLNVYNLSNMSTNEAEALILGKEGRVCVRFYRRQDGTILTDNCPVGLRRIRNFGRQVAAAIALAISSIIMLGNHSAFAEKNKCPEPLMGAMSSPPTLTETDSPYRIDLEKRIAIQWHVDIGPVASLHINREGVVESVTIVKSCGDPSIDSDAIRSIKAMKIPAFPKWCEDSTLTFTIDLNSTHQKK